MIYIHIPFCIQKCHYCDFHSYEAKADERAKYVSALIRSIEDFEGFEGFAGFAGFAGEGEKDAYSFDTDIASVYFGGGTPTILDADSLRSILQSVYHKFTLKADVEISIEANPETLDYDKLCKLKSMGFNRISIGAQSLDDRELMLLNRAHNADKFYEGFDNARKAGFLNINVDVISSIPGQSVKSFENTLRKLVLLKPEHISCYSLIVEEKTYLYENVTLFPALPSEEEISHMDDAAHAILKEAGYMQYELSNFARPGFECRHNIGYWDRAPYMGFGYGAASLMKKDGKEIRFERKRDSHEICNETFLSEHERMEEFMFLGLRKTKGVSRTDFQRIFGADLDNIYGKICKKHVENGLMVSDKDRLFLSKRGREVANIVMADFLF